MSKTRSTKLATYIGLAGSLLLTSNTLAHSEHDKARFVAENGEDIGNCGNRFRPCKSIAYAQEQAKKGDKILVARGQYHITSSIELLALNNALNPVYGGYSTIDNYRVQDAKNNVTTLTGVPAEYRTLAQKQGFGAIVDGKSQEFQETLAKSKLQLAAKQQRQTETACVNGFAGQFPCENISLVSHVPMSEFSATEANDIWGHHDLNTGIEYAIIGFHNGVSVVSLADPKNPVIVGKITQQNTKWRDVKVLQTFDKELALWQSYAYVTADSASEGLTVVDLNNLPNSISVATQDSTDRSAHNVYISNVDYTLNIAAGGEPGLHILGANNLAGSMRTYSLSDPSAPAVAYSNPFPNLALYTHDASSVTITDERANSQCVNGNANGCTLMLDFNEGEVRLWDHTDINNALQLSSFTYSTATYVHSGWWSEDRNYIFVHDELDERNRSLNTTVYIFDITDLQNPVQVGTWTGPTRTVDHNGFVRGNRYYMSNYERGLTILDITDPTSPQDIAFFDTYPLNNGRAFNGAWGVYPYLKSGLILVSDINSGLYVLRDETRSEYIGFTSQVVDVEEGETLDISVEKKYSGSTSVNYEVFTGTASSDDYVLENGTLEWSASNNDAKSFSLEILADNDSSEMTETLYVRLMDPKNGASLGDNYLLQVNITGVVSRGVISFVESQVTVLENQGTASIELNRVDGNSESISVDYALATANDDLELASGTLTWDANNAAPQSIELTIVDDALSEDNETYQLILTANDESVLGTTTTLDIIIRDDESNLTPSVDLVAEESFQADEFATVTAEGSDPEGDTLSWQWTQVSGPTITLVSADTATVEFTMPSGDIVLRATASDDFGVTTSSEVRVEQAAATPPAPTPVTPPQSETNGGSSSGGSSSGGSSSGGSVPLGALLLGGLIISLRKQEKQN